MSYSPNVLRWLNIARGLDSEYTETHKFGTNEAVPTTFVPIARGGVYQTPVAAAALELVSSSANDTSAGTGARTVTVVGLNSSWVEVSQDVTMNGTTAVALGTNLIRAYRMYVKTSGTYATASAGSHAGTLTLRGSGGGSTWLQIYFTDFPRGQSECGAYTIPSGKSALVSLHYVSVDSTKTGDIAFFHRANADTVAAPYTGAMRAQTEFVGLTGFANMIDSTSPLGPFVGPCDVGFMGKVSTGTGSISVDFEITLYDT